MLHSLFGTGIYGYLDLALIGWTLGLVWLGALALVQKGSLADKVRAGLENERFLFGGWGGKARQAAGGWLFLVSVALLQFDVFFMNSLVRDTGARWYAFLAARLEVVYFLLLVAKMLFFTRYSGLQLGAGFCFLFIFHWVFLNNADFWPVVGMFYFLGAKDIPLRRTLKVGLAVSAACFFAVVSAACLGWIGSLYNTSSASAGRFRNSFGYGWFNMTGAVLLALCVMYLCWRQIKNLKWFDFVPLAAALVFCDRGPDSRAATVCIALLIALAAVLRLFPRLAKPMWIRVLVSVAPAAAFAVSLATAWFYSEDDRLLQAINSLTTGRIMLGHQALTGSSIAIAGQRLTDSGFVVDNFYLNLWIYGGPVVSLLFWGAITALLWRLMKKGAYTESACLVAMLAHATMEPHIIWPCINVCLWLLPCVLYLLPAERVSGFAAPEKAA